MAFFSIKFLKCCFVIINKGNYFLSILGGSLMFDQNDIPIVYVFINHTISDYAESINLTARWYFRIRNCYKLFFLYCFYRLTGRNRTQERYANEESGGFQNPYPSRAFLYFFQISLCF